MSLLVLFLQQLSVTAQVSLSKSVSKQSRLGAFSDAPDCSSWSYTKGNWCVSRRMVAPVKIGVCKKGGLKSSVMLIVVRIFVLLLQMMQNLLLEEGGLVQVESVNLQVATYSKFQPQSPDFLDITNPKAVYPSCLLRSKGQKFSSKRQRWSRASFSGVAHPLAVVGNCCCSFWNPKGWRIRVKRRYRLLAQRVAAWVSA